MGGKWSDQNEIPTFGRNSRNWLVDLVLVLVHLRNASNYLVSDHYLSLSFNLLLMGKSNFGSSWKIPKTNVQTRKYDLTWSHPIFFIIFSRHSSALLRSLELKCSCFLVVDDSNHQWLVYPTINFRLHGITSQIVPSFLWKSVVI